MNFFPLKFSQTSPQTLPNSHHPVFPRLLSFFLLFHSPFLLFSVERTCSFPKILSLKIHNSAPILLKLLRFCLASFICFSPKCFVSLVFQILIYSPFPMNPPIFIGIFRILIPSVNISFPVFSISFSPFFSLYFNYNKSEVSGKFSDKGKVVSVLIIVRED